MASWFPFASSQDEDEEDQQHQNPSSPTLGQTIGRQLRGVADFLAPPPSSSTVVPAAAGGASSPDTFVGIKNDLVEIGDSFKTSLSLLSSNKAVMEISRFATNFLQFGGQKEEEEEDYDDDDDGDEESVGITDQIVEFVDEISKRPELWTGFPITLTSDIGLSDVQQAHAASVEDLVPSLAALKHEICNYLNEGQFWKIYFILLLPRLNESDYKLLSTPEIVEARDILLQKLQNKNNMLAETSESSAKCTMKKNAPVDTYDLSEKLQKKNNAPVETFELSETVATFQEGDMDNSAEANKIPSHGNEGSAKLLFNVATDSKINCHVKAKWFKEKGIDTSAFGDGQKQSEDDTSCSDLEDEDAADLMGKRPMFRQEEPFPSCSESGEWVQVNETVGTPDGQQKAVQPTSGEKDSESGDSNEWLTIDDTDLDRPPSV